MSSGSDEPSVGFEIERAVCCRSTIVCPRRAANVLVTGLHGDWFTRVVTPSGRSRQSTRPGGAADVRMTVPVVVRERDVGQIGLDPVRTWSRNFLRQPVEHTDIQTLRIRHGDIEVAVPVDVVHR